MFMSKKVILSAIGGFVLGKAGNAIFGSETAVKYYTKAATGAFIAKDAIMEQVEKIQAGAMDIAVDARLEADRYQEKLDAEYNEADAGGDTAAAPEVAPQL